jgi:AraC-like DNA-binding protein
MIRTVEEIRNLVKKHVRGEYTPTSIPRLTLIHGYPGVARAPTIVSPRICLTLQGSKSITVGKDGLRYSTGQYFLSSFEVPAIIDLTEATSDYPYLGISLSFDPSLIAALLLQMPPIEDPEFIAGLGVGDAEPDLLDAFLRIVRLVEKPREVAVMAPLLEREILFRLLQGPHGPKLRQIARVDSRLSQVSRALAWIRENHTESFKIEDLTKMTGMSVSVFHRHFRSITGMTPIQYQKHCRLHAAREKLLTEPGDMARVAFAVGYESVSQFSREYARLFGSPPVRDVRRLRTNIGTRVAADRGL